MTRASVFAGLVLAACGARTELEVGGQSDALVTDVTDASDASDEQIGPFLALADSAGFFRSKAGSLVAWGAAPNGEINTDAGLDAYSPAIFPTPTLVPTTGYPLQPSPMADGSCVLASDGTVYCWGINGVFDIHDVSPLTLAPGPPGAPVVLGAVQVWASQNSQQQCARMGDGSVKCWRYWPVCNPAFSSSDASLSYETTPIDRPDFATLSSFALSQEFACGLEGSTVYCCGNNNLAGQLGDGTTINHTTLAPANVQGSAIAVAVGSGASACAILSDSTAQCWGWNSEGELGDGTDANDRLNPVPVMGLTNVAQLALGFYHSCALLTDHTARCWGDNTNGQIGEGTTTQHLTPVAVVSPSGTGMLSNIVELRASFQFTCALVASGDVYCWGSNDHGQLGDGTTTDRLVPTIVIGLPP